MVRRGKACRDGAHRFQPGKVGESPAARADVVDVAAKAAIGCDGSAERVQRLSDYRGAELIRRLLGRDPES